MTLIEKIEYLMKENSLNRRQLSISSGIPYSTLDNLWKRDTASMRLPTFKRLCDFFGVTMASMAYDELDIMYLGENTTEPDSVVLSPGENTLIDRYRQMNDDGKTELQKRADELLALGYKKESVASQSSAG